ncbi:MAG: methyltransferase domain-containing protein [Armatimonadetes bacterium]|nr:methyltransferase domain-containing protein [Armatimonadota bacterium]
MPWPVPASEKRTPEQLREHYEVEKELADRLRAAPKQDRARLYSELYDELFRRLPHHPQLSRKADSDEQGKVVAFQMQLLRHFITPETVFLEIGAGDCALTFEVAKTAKKAIAVEVSAEVTQNKQTPENFELALSDGSSIPVPNGTATLAYSNQLIEHLHVEDAKDHLKQVCDALAPGGQYVCITPNGISGPYDVSMYFDETPTGFHMKEYSMTELGRMMRQAGFSKVQPVVGAKGRLILAPLWVYSILEGFLLALPLKLRKKVSRWEPIRKRISVKLVATK